MFINHRNFFLFLCSYFFLIINVYFEQENSLLPYLFIIFYFFYFLNEMISRFHLSYSHTINNHCPLKNIENTINRNGFYYFSNDSNDSNDFNDSNQSISDSSHDSDQSNKNHLDL